MFIFSDFCLALVLIDETLPHEWLYREGFTHSRKLLLLQWLLYGSILLMGYKCVLLSNLVPIRYEQTIDNLYDLDKSELRFVVANILLDAIESDTRSVVKRVLNKTDVFILGEIRPQWVNERYLWPKIHLLNISLS